MTDFRLLGPSDAPEMATLHAQGFAEPERWSEEALIELLAQPSIEAYGLAQPLSAFMLVQLAIPEAEILTLVVGSQHRRKGLARTLLLQTSKTLSARGITRWLLDVAEDNSEACAFYRSAGFKSDGRRNGYYPRVDAAPVDAILMSRPAAGQGW